MRVRIDIDDGAAATAPSDVAPAAGMGTGGEAINGGSPSAELLEAVAAAGGLTIAPDAVSSMATGSQAIETLDAGGAPG
jgi:hypothetical protein